MNDTALRDNASETGEAGAKEARADGETLSDGRRATLTRPPRGRDLEKAYDIAGKRATNPVTLMLALFALVGKIDGKPMVYEDLRELPLADATMIVGMIGGDAGPL
jgi:hypothetical protein